MTALAALTGAGGPAHAAPSPLTGASPLTRTLAPAATSDAQTVSARTVTLLTGDQVTVFPSGAFTVLRGPGRRDVDFFTSRAAGHLRVVPGDAAELVRSGQLDERLFNVTDLIEQGYDDRRNDLPLIIGTGNGTEAVAKAQAAVASPDTAEVRALPHVHAVALHRAKSTVGEFWQRLTGGNSRVRSLGEGIGHIWLDGKSRVLLDRGVPQIGAPTAWRAGYTGTGVTVAVLDTGIDPAHPDLAGRISATRNFTEGAEGDADLAGHGTHVASTIVGSGAASDGRYRGVAPEARLAVGKVCIQGGCAESWILAGMQWAAADTNAKVVSMSLGGRDAPGLDPLEQAVETLTAKYGTLFVVAAGNDGADGSVSSPASAPSSLAVGAVDTSDALASFSSRGPRAGDDALKPDITAPGVDITAARSKDSSNPGDSYTTMSGTSMATPHAAGAAALLTQQHPDWTPQQLKAALMASASPNSKIGGYAQGAGRVDLTRAITTSITAQPASVSFGRPHYPHGDDQPIATPVSYHNSGPASVTLNVEINATIATTTNTVGTAAPTGMFRVTPSTVTVPAGGDATVTIIADTSTASPNGYACGYLTATGGEQVIRTPFAVHKEVESYDLTFTHLDRSGAATHRYLTTLISLDGRQRFDAHPSATGVTILRVPKGRYIAESYLIDADTNQRSVTALVQPRLEVTSDRHVNVDARTAKPVAVDVTVPEGAAQADTLAVGWDQDDDDGTPMASGGGYLNGSTHLFTGQLGPASGAASGFTSHLGGVWGEKTDTGTVSANRFTATVASYTTGAMSTGLTRRVTAADLAAVHVRQSSTMPGSLAQTGALPHRPGRRPDTDTTTSVPLPNTRTEYYTTDGGVEWTPVIQEYTSDRKVTTRIESPSLRLEAEHRYETTRNMGVFGPSLAHADASPIGVWRAGDTVNVNLPLLGDGAGSTGFSTVTAGETTLTANGVPVGSTTVDGWGGFTVPARNQRYQLTASAQRDAPAVLSTRVRGVWTFRSGHVAAATALPLWTIGFTPQLGDTNTAAAGRQLTLPVRTESQPGAKVGTLTNLDVEVSFDDGTTWKPAPVHTAHGATSVTMSHPDGTGFVSLRVNAADSAGNTVNETIIRAYQYTPASQ